MCQVLPCGGPPCSLPPPVVPAFPPTVAAAAGPHAHPGLNPPRTSLQLGMFVYKYHTDVGIAFPYTGSLSGGASSQPTSEVAVTAAAAAAAQQQQQQQQQQQPVIVYSGASGAGTLIDSSLSAAEIDNMLKPGSSGHSPFDALRYPGFCRKMRVRRGAGMQVYSYQWAAAWVGCPAG